MSIETFKGRKGKYNKSILKALYEKGYLSAWKIAREIVDNDPKRQKRNWYHETQKVYSVLVRKGGRLEELVGKEFIENTELGYRLTENKGLCSALTLYEDVIEPKIDLLSGAYEIIPELKEAVEIISRLYPKDMLETYKIMRRATEELLDKGLNFDVLSNSQFNAFFKDQMERSALQEVKKEKETGRKWESNPELQALTLKMVDRMKKIVLRELEKLDKEINSFKESTRKPPQQQVGTEP